MKKSEGETNEWRRIYDALKAEYVERFWKEDNNGVEAATLNNGAMRQ